MVDVHLVGKAVLAVDAVAPMPTEVAFRMDVKLTWRSVHSSTSLSGAR